LSSLTARARYRRTEASSFQPGALGLPGEASARSGTSVAGVFTENNSSTLTPNMTLTWASGVVTTVQVSHQRAEVLTSGNLTVNEETRWGGRLNFSFKAPRMLARLPNDIRAAVAVSATHASLCLQRVTSAECVIVSDSRRQQVDVRLDTGFPPSMRAGATFSYVLRDERHTSSKLSQFVLTVFLDINFLASQVR
jgi:hypothetical protein